jgi:hypothetical protein
LPIAQGELISSFWFLVKSQLRGAAATYRRVDGESESRKN